MSWADKLASAALVSTSLMRVLLFLRTWGSSAKGRNWRLILPGCRKEPKSWCRAVKMQKRRPRGQPPRGLHGLLAHSCLPELTVAVAKGQRQTCSQKGSIGSPHSPEEMSWPLCSSVSVWKIKPISSSPSAYSANVKEGLNCCKQSLWK